jgi:YtcA family
MQNRGQDLLGGAWTQDISVANCLVTWISSGSEMATRLRTRARNAVLCLASVCLAGCSVSGAPSFDLFGAFFPAWLLCGAIGIAGASIARAVFVSSGLSNVLPYQLAVCTAIGVITAVVVCTPEYQRQFNRCRHRSRRSGRRRPHYSAPGFRERPCGRGRPSVPDRSSSLSPGRRANRSGPGYRRSATRNPTARAGDPAFGRINRSQPDKKRTRKP